MASNYSIHLSTPDNVKLAIITEFNSLSYIRSVNQIGLMTLTISKSLINPTFFKKDARLEIWRSIQSSEYLETKTQWLIQSIEFERDIQLYTITAVSGLDIIRRRYITRSQLSFTDKTGPADDVIYEYVNENLGSDAQVSRKLINYINIQSSPGLGATIYKSSSQKPLLSTIQECAQDSAEAGTPLFFDVEYDPGSKLFEFKTFIGQRGIDHSTDQALVTLSPDIGNLAEVYTSLDYSDEYTYVYAIGKGMGDERQVSTAENTLRVNQSPFGLVELIVNANSTDSSANTLLSEAQSALRNSRPRRIITARIINRQSTQYGVHWNWGDKVKVEIDQQVYNARIDTIEGDISNKKETIKAGIRLEDD